MKRPKHILVKTVFLFAVIANVTVWAYARDVQARWLNVPPVPSEAGAISAGLGDPQFAYRTIAIMLQNLGDTGGRTTRPKDYNFERLAGWFALVDKLDPHSNLVPSLAAFNYSNVKDPQKMQYLVEYLAHVGQNPEGNKWRWLAQAIYLLRFEMNDQEKALEYAHLLASFDYPDMPGWVHQMPAFIMTNMGKKEAAYALLLELLKTKAQDLHPNEVNHTRDYICTRILEESEAAKNPICQKIP